ncbi:hypothetical protein STENM327S_02475 [Streptomyces tendae]
MGTMLLDMGKDPARFSDDDYDAGIARLQKGVHRARYAASPATTTRPTSAKALRGLSGLGR